MPALSCPRWPGPCVTDVGKDTFHPHLPNPAPRPSVFAASQRQSAVDAPGALCAMLLMQDSFVSDPNNLVQNGQTVSVKVSSWDPATNRLSLTMKLDSGSEGAADGGSLGDDGQARRNPRQGKVATAGECCFMQSCYLADLLWP